MKKLLSHRPLIFIMALSVLSVQNSYACGQGNDWQQFVHFINDNCGSASANQRVLKGFNAAGVGAGELVATAKPIPSLSNLSNLSNVTDDQIRVYDAQTKQYGTPTKTNIMLNKQNRSLELFDSSLGFCNGTLPKLPKGSTIKTLHISNLQCHKSNAITSYEATALMTKDNTVRIFIRNKQTGSTEYRVVNKKA